MARPPQETEGGRLPPQTVSIRPMYLTHLLELRAAERRALLALPRLIRAARSGRLRSVLEETRERADGHLRRLETMIDPAEADRAGEPRRREPLETTVLRAAQRLGDPAALDLSLVRVVDREVGVAVKSYAWAEFLAERLGRQEDGAILRRSMVEKSETGLHLLRVAGELLFESPVNGDPAGSGRLRENGGAFR